MVAYNDIPDTDVDPESPQTTSLWTRVRDNPIAIAEGADGAPKVSPLAFWGNVGDGSDGPMAIGVNTVLDPDIYSFTTFSLTASAIVTLSAKGAIVIRCSESFTMADGTSFDLSGDGGAGGAGARTGANPSTQGLPGEGQSDSSPFTTPMWFGGSGGGGGAYSVQPTGDGGSTYGVPGGDGISGSGGNGGTPDASDLTKMLSFGQVLRYGGGGGGGGSDASGGVVGGNGGAGGGLLIVVAPAITLGNGALIDVSGLNGENKPLTNSAGGGGGGGAILMLCQEFLDNGASVNLSGGAKGTSGGANGGDGGTGFFSQITI